MTVLVLARHATQALGPDDDPDQLFSPGNRDLGDRGVREAGALAELLADRDPDAVVASPLQRCRRTAEIVARPHGLDVEVEEGLAEVPFADGTRDPSYDDVLEAIRDLAFGLLEGEDPRLGTGERFSEVRDRILAAVERVEARGDEVLCVAHGGTNRVVLADALGLPWHRIFDLEQDHACVNVLDRRGERTIVRVVNALASGLPRAQQ